MGALLSPPMSAPILPFSWWPRIRLRRPRVLPARLPAGPALSARSARGGPVLVFGRDHRRVLPPHLPVPACAAREHPASRHPGRGPRDRLSPLPALPPRSARAGRAPSRSDPGRLPPDRDPRRGPVLSRPRRGRGTELIASVSAVPTT